MKLNSPDPKNHPLFNCGKQNCPICAKAYSQFKIKDRIIKDHFSTEAVAPFIGRFGYPMINVGVLAPPEAEKDTWMFDAPKYWAANDFEIPKIVEFRSSLINSKANFNVKKRNQFLELNQEAALASLPTDMDVNLKKKPSFRMNYDNMMAPQGPQAQIKKAKLTENAKIHTKVQKVHYDTDLKAVEAINYLYENKFDENFLSRILSVGTLGVGKNRKLVPTRWSITATDDTIGKKLIQEVKDFQQINYSAYFGSYMGNHYLILCFPEVWSYELFETLVANPSHFKSDHEFFDGRKYYADNTAGGYYTVRLAILEEFKRKRRQGASIALRFITGDYTLPLGVWVTREATRKAMLNGPIEFGSKELILEYARKLIKRKFNINVDTYLKQSKILNEIKQQKKLFDFA